MLDLNTTFPVRPFDPDMEVKSVPWLVENFWQKGKINVMFGPEKAGKSRLLNWLLVNSFVNEDVVGLKIIHRPKRVLYLAAEELVEDVNSRFLRYLAFAGAVPRQALIPVDFISAAGLRLDHGHQRKWLEEKLVNEEYDLLVIDPLRRVHGADENDNTAMSQIFNDFRRWTNVHGISMVLLHHTGKLGEDAAMDRIATWGRGASDLAAILDTAQFVDRQSPKLVRVLRAGRFRPVPALGLFDGEDHDFVFRKKEGK